ncbi:MAG: PTS sugar transporter subunit IIA [Anaerolineales bacterium]|nr:PTS sugar transporter subunit IIA [Anaerolineales bacterium]
MSLMELLPKERIAVAVEADDWESAVRAAGRLLVETGAAEERYIDGMIATTKELGPYIVIAPGVAIPHSRPEDGVLKPSLAFLKLTKPVEFGHQENDPVHLVIALGATDHDQHVEALGTIAKILMDEASYTALLSAQTVDDVTKVLYQT